MTRRVLLVRSLIIFLLTGISAAYAVSGPVLYEGGFERDGVTWSRTADGAWRMDIDDGRVLSVSDQPDLQVRDFLLLVPADLAVAGVTVEPLAIRTEKLPGRLAVAGPLETSTGKLLEQRYITPVDGVFPPTWGTFGGLQSWRGYRLLAVTVHPCRVVADDGGEGGHLEILERFAVRAILDSSRLPAAPLVRERRVEGERAALEGSLKNLVANPSAVIGYDRAEGAPIDKAGAPHLPTPSPSLEGSGVRYLIVTSEELETQFQVLADHRTAQGLPAKVVTREWIEATQRHGIDFQETLRMFLQDAYARWGMEYLLLGGDTGIIPPRVIRSPFYPYGGYTDVPTDIYYSGLDGTWAADGDGWLGEEYTDETDLGDDADFAPDVAIGRAPVRDAVGAQQFVAKVLTYESAGAGEPWADRMLYAAEVLFPSPWSEGDSIMLDGSEYAQALDDSAILPCTDMTSVHMYETEQTFPRDARLTRAAFIDSLNTGHYGHVNQFGHGHFFNMSVGDANFTVMDAAALHNGPHFFMLFAVNCASGAYDVACLMERFVENPDGGAIVSVGAAREAFPSNSFGYQTVFYDALACDGTQRISDAFNVARMASIANTARNTIDRWTQLNAVVLGDPATTIWVGAPIAPEIAAPAALMLGEQTVVVTVSAGGAPVAGADVCLRKSGETYAQAVTDANGEVSLTVMPQASGNAVLTVSGANLAMTSRQIPVAGESYVALDGFEIEDDPSAANGNGVPEAGEVVAMTLTLRDTGGAGASGLTATMTSEDGKLVVLTGEATSAYLAPGGTVTVGPYNLLLSSSCTDGETLPFQVTVTSGEESWLSDGALEVLAPEPEVVRVELDDSIYGNGNGVVENGERVVVMPFVKNFGAGRVGNLLVQILDLAPGVTAHTTFGSYDDLDLLDEATCSGGELSLSMDDVDVLTPCRLQFQYQYNQIFSQTLQFVKPAAPPLPEADPTLADDAIALRWDPVDDPSIIGYHVYRSVSEAGPFTRANQDLVAGASYFEDRGLDQLTPYWYRVTAVDSYFAESEFSPVVSQGTMPAEVQNFPLPFKLQTSGHSAVGDVNGDGRLEIVLPSDEVYCWNDDGSEVADGDQDAQTTGPFTTTDGQFGPAGVAMADLDGEPGLEIVASAQSDGNSIHIYKSDGSALAGWPRPLLSSWNWATPAVGDIDGDGDLEVVVNDLEGRTFVWHHDGTEFVDGDANPETDGVFLDRNESWGISSPALFDLDNDGAAEIIFGTRSWSSDNALLAYRYDGSQADGFPFSVGSPQILNSPAVADLDHDGTVEIVFFTTQHRLYVVHQDGTEYPGFPVYHSNNWDDSAGPSVALGNFDADTDLEILWPDNGGTFRMDLLVIDTGIGDGTAGDIMDGWPVSLPCNSEGSPVIGDITGDGVVDVIQPVGNSETETADMLYAYSGTGELLAGFPIAMDGHGRSTPVLCDLEGDGDIDIVYGSWDNLLHVWDMPAPYDPRLVPWPTFHGNSARTGVMHQLSITAVDDPLVPEAFTVLPPHPNPFNPSTTITLYVVPSTNPSLDLSIYDVKGRRIRRLHAGETSPGWREFTWDGRDDRGRGQASGVYFVRARQAADTQTHKMTLVK